jgi:hypothetical protein
MSGRKTDEFASGHPGLACLLLVSEYPVSVAQGLVVARRSQHGCHARIGYLEGLALWTFCRQGGSHLFPCSSSYRPGCTLRACTFTRASGSFDCRISGVHEGFYRAVCADERPRTRPLGLVQAERDLRASGEVEPVAVVLDQEEAIEDFDLIALRPFLLSPRNGIPDAAGPQSSSHG